MAHNRPAFLTAEWRYLVMLNFEIDPGRLESLVPIGTELDFWNGRTYVSMVGFRFLNTRLLGFPIPFHRNFSEVNLRFYVRRRTGDNWRRGVVFIKEIVPLPAVTLVARKVYNENYITLAMQHRVNLPGSTQVDRGSVSYSWKWQERWMELCAETSGVAQPIGSGSEEEFITEHYWGYTRQRDGGTMEYQVEHPRWNIWQTESSRIIGAVEALYGSQFGEVLLRPPTSSFVADGSAIVVRKGCRLS